MVLVVLEKCSSRIPHKAFVPDNYRLLKLFINILAQGNPIKTTFALWVLACIRFQACLGCVVAVIVGDLGICWFKGYLHLYLSFSMLYLQYLMKQNLQLPCRTEQSGSHSPMEHPHNSLIGGLHQSPESPSYTHHNDVHLTWTHPDAGLVDPFPLMAPPLDDMSQPTPLDLTSSPPAHSHVPARGNLKHTKFLRGAGLTLLPKIKS